MRAAPICLYGYDPGTQPSRRGFLLVASASEGGSGNSEPRGAGEGSGVPWLAPNGIRGAGPGPAAAMWTARRGIRVGQWPKPRRGREAFRGEEGREEGPAWLGLAVCIWVGFRGLATACVQCSGARSVEVGGGGRACQRPYE